MGRSRKKQEILEKRDWEIIQILKDKRQMFLVLNDLTKQEALSIKDAIIKATNGRIAVTVQNPQEGLNMNKTKELNDTVIKDFNKLLSDIESFHDLKVVYDFGDENVNSTVTLYRGNDPVKVQSSALDGQTGILKECLKLIGILK